MSSLLGNFPRSCCYCIMSSQKFYDFQQRTSHPFSSNKVYSRLSPGLVSVSESDDDESDWYEYDHFEMPQFECSHAVNFQSSSAGAGINPTDEVSVDTTQPVDMPPASIGGYIVPTYEQYAGRQNVVSIKSISEDTPRGILSIDSFSDLLSNQALSALRSFVFANFSNAELELQIAVQGNPMALGCVQFGFVPMTTPNEALQMGASAASCLSLQTGAIYAPLNATSTFIMRLPLTNVLGGAVKVMEIEQDQYTPGCLVSNVIVPYQLGPDNTDLSPVVISIRSKLTGVEMSMPVVSPTPGATSIPVTSSVRFQSAILEAVGGDIAANLATSLANTVLGGDQKDNDLPETSEYEVFVEQSSFPLFPPGVDKNVAPMFYGGSYPVMDPSWLSEFVSKPLFVGTFELKQADAPGDTLYQIPIGLDTQMNLGQQGAIGFTTPWSTLGQYFEYYRFKEMEVTLTPVNNDFQRYMVVAGLVYGNTGDPTLEQVSNQSSYTLQSGQKGVTISCPYVSVYPWLVTNPNGVDDDYNDIDMTTVGQVYVKVLNSLVNNSMSPPSFEFMVFVKFTGLEFRCPKTQQHIQMCRDYRWTEDPQGPVSTSVRFQSGPGEIELGGDMQPHMNTADNDAKTTSAPNLGGNEPNEAMILPWRLRCVINRETGSPPIMFPLVDSPGGLLLGSSMDFRSATTEPRQLNLSVPPQMYKENPNYGNYGDVPAITNPGAALTGSIYRNYAYSTSWGLTFTSTNPASRIVVEVLYDPTAYTKGWTYKRPFGSMTTPKKTWGSMSGSLIVCRPGKWAQFHVPFASPYPACLTPSNPSHIGDRRRNFAIVRFWSVSSISGTQDDNVGNWQVTLDSNITSLELYARIGESHGMGTPVTLPTSMISGVLQRGKAGQTRDLFYVPTTLRFKTGPGPGSLATYFSSLGQAQESINKFIDSIDVTSTAEPYDSANPNWWNTTEVLYFDINTSVLAQSTVAAVLGVTIPVNAVLVGDGTRLEVQISEKLYGLAAQIPVTITGVSPTGGGHNLDFPPGAFAPPAAGYDRDTPTTSYFYGDKLTVNSMAYESSAYLLTLPLTQPYVVIPISDMASSTHDIPLNGSSWVTVPGSVPPIEVTNVFEYPGLKTLVTGLMRGDNLLQRTELKQGWESADDKEDQVEPTRLRKVNFQSSNSFHGALSPNDVVKDVRFQSDSPDVERKSAAQPKPVKPLAGATSSSSSSEDDTAEEEDPDKPPGPLDNIINSLVGTAKMVAASGMRAKDRFREFWKNPKEYLEVMCARIAVKLGDFVKTTVNEVANSTFSDLWTMIKNTISQIPTYLVVAAVLMIVSELALRVETIRNLSTWILQGLLQVIDTCSDMSSILNRKLVEAIRTTREAFQRFGSKLGLGGNCEVEDPETSTHILASMNKAEKLINDDVKADFEESSTESFGSKMKHWAMILVSYFTIPEISTVMKGLKTAAAAIAIVNIMDRTTSSFCRLFEKFSNIFPVYYTLIASYFATDMPADMRPMEQQIAFMSKVIAIDPTSSQAVSIGPKFKVYRTQLIQFQTNNSFRWCQPSREFLKNLMVEVDRFYQRLPKKACETSRMRMKPVSVGFYGAPGIGKDVALTALISKFDAPDQVATINISQDNRVEKHEYNGQTHLRLGEIFNVEDPESDKQVVTFFQRLVDNIPFCADSAYDKGEVWIHPHYVWWSTNKNLGKGIKACVNIESWMRRSLHILCVLREDCATDGKVCPKKVENLNLKEGEQLIYHVMMTNPVRQGQQEKSLSWKTGQYPYSLKPHMENCPVAVGEEIIGSNTSEWCQGYHGVSMKRTMNFQELIDAVQRCSVANAKQLQTLHEIAYASTSSYSVFSRDICQIDQSTITRSQVAKALARLGNKWLLDNDHLPNEWRLCFEVSSAPRTEKSCPFSGMDCMTRDEDSMASRIYSKALEFNHKTGSDELEGFLLQLEDGHISYLGMCLVNNGSPTDAANYTKLKARVESPKPGLCRDTLENLLKSERILTKYFPGSEAYTMRIAPGSDDYFYFERDGVQIEPDVVQLAMKQKILNFVMALSNIEHVHTLDGDVKIEATPPTVPEGMPDALTKDYWGMRKPWKWVSALYKSTGDLGQQMYDNPGMTALAAICMYRTFENLNKVTRTARSLIAQGVPTGKIEPLTPGLRENEEYTVSKSHELPSSFLMYDFKLEVVDDSGQVEKIGFEELLDEFLEFTFTVKEPQRALEIAKTFIETFCYEHMVEVEEVKDAFQICHFEKTKECELGRASNIIRESSTFRQKVMSNITGIFCSSDFLVTFLAETLRKWSSQDIGKRALLLTEMLEENGERIQVTDVHFDSGTGGRGRRKAKPRRVRVQMPISSSVRMQAGSTELKNSLLDSDVWTKTGWSPLEANQARLAGITSRVGKFTTNVFGVVQSLGAVDLGNGTYLTTAHSLYTKSGLAKENMHGGGVGEYAVNPIAIRALIKYEASDGVITTMGVSSNQVTLVKSISSSWEGSDSNLNVDLAMIYRGPGPTIKKAGSIFLPAAELKLLTSFSHVVFITPGGKQRYIGNVIIEPEASVVGAYGFSPFRHCGILRYRAPRSTLDGCCGGVYVGMWRGNIYVLAIHAATTEYRELNSASTSGSYATGILVSRETMVTSPPSSEVYNFEGLSFPPRKIPKLCDYDPATGSFVDRERKADPPSDEKVCALAQAPSFKEYHEKPGNGSQPSAQYIGCVDERKSKNDSKTALRPSPSQTLTGSNHKPSFQGGKNVTSSDLKGLGLLRSRSKENEAMNLDDYKHAITYMIDVARTIPPKDPLKMFLTPEEAINGGFVDMMLVSKDGTMPTSTTLSNEGLKLGDPDYVSGTMRIKGLDATASAGWPSGLKTGDFLTTETRVVDGVDVQVKVIDLSTEYGRQADALLKRVLDSLMDGECVWLTFSVALKDEALPTTKVKEWLRDIFPDETEMPKGGKTRIISIIAWVVNLAIKMFLGPMVTYFKYLGTRVSWVNSKNLYSTWIDEFFESMAHVIRSEQPANFMGGDVSNQEGELDHVTIKALCMLKSKFDDLQKHWATGDFYATGTSEGWGYRRLNFGSLKKQFDRYKRASLCMITSMMPTINKIDNKFFLMETRNPSGSWITSFLAYFFGLAMDRKTIFDIKNLVRSFMKEKNLTLKSVLALGGTLVEIDGDQFVSFSNEEGFHGKYSQNDVVPLHQGYGEKLYAAYTSLAEDALDFDKTWVSMFSGDDILAAASAELTIVMSVTNVMLSKIRVHNFHKRNQLPTPPYIQPESLSMLYLNGAERLENLRCHAGSLYASVCKHGTGVVLNDPSGGALKFCAEEDVTFLGNTFESNWDLSDYLAERGCIAETFAVIEPDRLVKSSEWVRPHDDMNKAWISNLNQILELSFTAGKDIFESRRTKFLAQMDQLGILGDLVTFESCANRFIRHDYCLGDEDNSFT